MPDFMVVPCPDIQHCIEKIAQIVADRRDDRRGLLQLGYNLGRLAELTGRGREPFWDAWKGAVAAGDWSRMDTLAHQLQFWTPLAPSTDAATSDPAEGSSR